MKAKFTPGTWDIKPEEADKDYIRIRGTTPGGRFKVANVLNPVYEGAHIREAEETRANARLIAAAPDLFSAAIDSMRLLKSLGMESSDEYQSLLSATEKVYGE